MEGNEKLWLHAVWSSRTKQASFAFDLNVAVLREEGWVAFLLHLSISYCFCRRASVGGDVESLDGAWVI